MRRDSHRESFERSQTHRVANPDVEPSQIFGRWYGYVVPLHRVEFPRNVDVMDPLASPARSALASDAETSTFLVGLEKPTTFPRERRWMHVEPGVTEAGPHHQLFALSAVNWQVRGLMGRE